jgi:glycosyltransferase involved in cell wall biosynthesis
VLVVNPQSPDGTRELLASTARSFPHVRVREVAVGHEIAKNKGTMLNAAIRASRGEWIWLTDADCLFPPDCLGSVLDQIAGRQNRLFYAQRRYLGEGQTDGLLSGRLDSLKDFSELAAAADGRSFENAPWGYTQIVHRSVLSNIGYCEHINHFAHCDDIFVQECRRRRVLPEQLPGLFCLHLHHPFSWYGTDAFL